jgi:putative hydrolase of the HAD superfamily
MEHVVAEDLRCTPPVRRALLAAREKQWHIVIVTNGGDAQAAKIRRTGIDQLVDAYCVSGSEGVAKPDPRFFEIAARRGGETLSRAWIIGDGADTDIAPACLLGVRNIWISGGRPWAKRDFAPTFAARAFADAIGIVLEIGEPLGKMHMRIGERHRLDP